MNIRFKGSTVAGSADRGSCYPARCAEALSASTHQGKHYLPHPRGKHYLPQPRSDGALKCKAHIDTFRYNCTSIVSAQLPSSAFSFLASIFVSVHLLPGPSSSPRRKHFLPLRLHFHIVKSTSCLLSCCPMAVLRAPSRVACMAPIQFH